MKTNKHYEEILLKKNKALRSAEILLTALLKSPNALGRVERVLNKVERALKEE